jgi:phage I-like protein
MPTPASRSPARRRSAFIALLAAGLALQAQAEVQLLPAGDFAARDGRPGPGKTWRLNDAEGERLAAQITRTAQQSAFCIDFDHQTIRSEANGQPAPAAAFATRFEWRKGVGLFATDVAWTERAKAYIESGEYKYLSPVIKFDDAGRITGVLMAAITNYPALLGMAPIGTQLCAVLAAQFTDPDADPSKETDMALLATLIATLGLTAQATEAEALSAVSALRTTAEAAGARPVVPQALGAALGLAAGADEAAALSAVAALKASGDGKGAAKGTGDGETLALVSTLQAQVTELSGQINERNVLEAVDAAIAAGKLLPAMRDWALGIGRADIAQLHAYIKAAPAAQLGQPQSGGAKGGAGDGKGGGEHTAALSAQELDVCTRMGITPEAYRAAAVAAA